MSLKDDIRKRILEKRFNLSASEIERSSRIIVNKLQDDRLISKYITPNTSYKKILAYSQANKEVDINSLVSNCLESGIDVYMPFISNMKQREMRAAQIFSLEADMQLGKFGISEPIKAQERMLQEQDLDMVLVPGVVFDTRLNRIGYGGGFYDRFCLKLRKNCVKIGIAYDFQVLDQIPIDNNDVPVDLIITEKRVIHNKNLVVSK